MCVSTRVCLIQKEESTSDVKSSGNEFCTSILCNLVASGGVADMLIVQ